MNILRHSLAAHSAQSRAVHSCKPVTPPRVHDMLTAVFPEPYRTLSNDWNVIQKRGGLASDDGGVSSYNLIGNGYGNRGF